MRSPAVLQFVVIGERIAHELVDPCGVELLAIGEVAGFLSVVQRPEYQSAKVIQSGWPIAGRARSVQPRRRHLRNEPRRTPL